jgi:hypothetical protein
MKVLTIGDVSHLALALQERGAYLIPKEPAVAEQALADADYVVADWKAIEEDHEALLLAATAKRVPMAVVFPEISMHVLRHVILKWPCIDQPLDGRAPDTFDPAHILGGPLNLQVTGEPLAIGSVFPIPNDPQGYENNRYVSLISPAMRTLMNGLRLALRQMIRGPGGEPLPPPWDPNDGQGSAITEARGKPTFVESRERPNLSDVLALPEDGNVRRRFLKNFTGEDPRPGTGWETLPPKLLILGESGTGKSLVAELVHSQLTVAPQAPLVKINCAGLDVGNFDHEMFGSAPGTWTGVGAVVGWLTRAAYGVAFLDEIGDLPLPTQARLLGFLDDLMLRPTGVSPFFGFLQVVAATNRDLDNRVALRKFRHDLLARFTARVTVPPLRERGPAELRHLIDFVAQNPAYNPVDLQGERAVHSISGEAMGRLLDHQYLDGNFRELEEIISDGLRRAQLSRSRVLEKHHLSIREEPRHRPDIEELVVRVAEVATEQASHTVTVASEAELRRVADIRGLPILDDGSQLVILDGTTVYRYPENG